MSNNRMVEDEIDRQEKERDSRMNIIGQNGNDGEHYEDEDLTVGDHANMSWVTPEAYTLDVTMIHDLEDVKDILEAMNLTLREYRHGASPVQKRLIDNGTFKKQ